MSAEASGLSRARWGPLTALEGVLGGHLFPVFMIASLLLFQAALLTLLLLPTGDDGMGAFVEAFKVWCFGYDPATGSLELVYVVMLVVDPLVLMALVVGVWWKPLRAVSSHPRQLIGPVAAAAGLVVACAGGLLLIDPGTRQSAGPLPFPGKRIRTALTPPPFRLTNQDGHTVALDDLRGRVVLVTAVYARCNLTCPMIMGQTRRALDALTEAERAGLTVAAITLDPARDDVAALARMATGQGISAPLYNLLTGEVAEVEAVLDRLGVTRQRDPETGEIDHANLFLLVDAQGRIAYRLALGDQQERWLVDALRELLAESRLAG